MPGTRKIFTFKVYGAVCLAALFFPLQQVQADATIDRIRQTKEIQIGHWPGEVPFSYLNEQKQPIGYSIDLCKKIVQDMSKKWGMELHVNWVEVDAKSRFSLMDEGKIDLLCADTTNTADRQKRFGFSHSIFVAGTRIITEKKRNLTRINDLYGKRIAVIASTTGETLVRNRVQNVEVIAAKGLDDAWEMLESRKVDGIGYDDVLLADRSARSKAGAGEYEFLTDYLSVEPYGLMLRKADTELTKAVNHVLSDLFISKDIYTIYNRWFVNKERNIPAGHILREDFLTPNNYPAYP